MLAGFDLLSMDIEKTLNDAGVTKECIDQLEKAGLGHFIPQMSNMLKDGRKGGGKMGRGRKMRFGQDRYMGEIDNVYIDEAKKHLKLANLIE